MNTPESGASFVNASGFGFLIRELLGRHAIKRLAALLDCPIHTAKSLLYNHFSQTRAREIITRCIEDIERDRRRQDEIIAELKRRMLGDR